MLRIRFHTLSRRSIPRLANKRPDKRSFNVAYRVLTSARVRRQSIIDELHAFVSGGFPSFALDIVAFSSARRRRYRWRSRCSGTCRCGSFALQPSVMQRPLARAYAPASATLPFGVTLACACCFSLSTACFHFLTISFAKSETSFALCVLSLPTAKPILLSCRGVIS
jgi:hypothetical protein